MKMKSILVLFVVLFGLARGDDEQAIRDLCRFRIGQFPHPNPALCYKYVQCQLLNGVVRECDSLFEIYVSGEGCVLGDRDTCERFVPSPTVPTLPTDPTPPIETTTPISNVCDGIEGVEFFPNPNDCTAFILCIAGIPEFLSCPAPTPVFDPLRGFCVPGNPTTCEIFDITTPPTLPTLPTTVPTPPTPPPPTITPPTPSIPIISTTTESSGSPSPREACRGNNFRFIPNKNYCYKYYFCLYGIPLPGECPKNRIFYERLGGCVRGNQDTCTRDRFGNIDIEIVTNRPIF